MHSPLYRGQSISKGQLSVKYHLAKDNDDQRDFDQITYILQDFQDK